jgi:diguanylate cyclase (GGDEF)-like protein/PAS domain S-box-containing protein
MSVRRRRDDPTAAFPHADQSDVDGAVVVGHAVAKGTDPAYPDEVVAHATSGRPLAGQSGSPEGADLAVPAGGPAFATPALLAALIAVALGLSVLLGWASGLGALSAFLPGALPMKPNAALLLVFLGTALAVNAVGHRPRLVDALAIVVLAVAFATTLEYATGVDLGIDRLLWSDVARSGAPYPGRMALGSVVGFGAGAFGLLSLGRTWRGWHLSAFLALIDALIGGLGVLGYAYGANELTSIGSVTQIAFPAALGLVVLAAGLIAADPHHGLMRVLRDPGMAGQMARRLLPTTLLVVPLAGWLKLALVQAGFFDDPLGVAVMVSFEVLVLGTVGVWTGVGLLRAERARAEAQRERDRVLDTSEDLICATDADGRFTLVSPSWTRHLGYEAGELLGHNIAEYVHPDDLGPATSFLADAERGAGVGAHVNRGRAQDGTYRWLEWNSSRDPETGRIYAVARDITERQAAHAALEASEERLRTALDTMQEGVTAQSAVRDRSGRITDFRTDYSNPAVSVISGLGRAERVGHTLLELFPAHRTNGLFDAYVRVVETGVPFASDDFRHVDPDAAGGPIDQVLDLRAARLGDGYVLSVRDVTLHHRADLEMRRLATAIKQSADAVVITDTSGAIEYVNPAFERVTGYSSDEVLGQNPRILKSGVQGPAFYAAMWATLASGNAFTGDLVNRRKDGSLFQEESVISAVRDEAGTITSYVGVNRNVTRERALEAAQERIARERALIAGTLAQLQILPTPGATADLICRQVTSLTGVASASLAYFTPAGAVVSLAFVRADGVPVPLRHLPFQRSRTLRERAEEGPWVEARIRRPWHPYDRLHTELGTRALAYAPVRHGRLIGLLTIASAEASAISRLTEILPALLEFAGFAGALLGPAIADLTEIGLTRDRISQTITDVAFRPVFQPIVDLATGEHAGYEALTRFSSGTAPDLVFADARTAGLEAELELATLAAAISAAATLPQGAWLSLNVSPSLVKADEGLGELLRRSNHPVVLEVTEHVAIPDYAALRAAIGRLRPEVRVAVDDAGAGIANFSHIVELRPAFVKLDIGLVRGVDTDLTRQALMVGLLRFASESASQTIAEGVETEEELATLRKLGVPLVQGYLVGRPAPAAEWVARADALSAGIARDDAATERDTITAARARATAERDTITAARARASAERHAVPAARDGAATERETIAEARDEAAAERETIAEARDEAAAERDTIAEVRDQAAAERDTIAGARDTAGRESAANKGADDDRERARLEKALRDARLDDLTGLDRRGMGRLALTNEIDRARRGDGRFVVAFIDVDGLKGVNDRDGHAAGDHVLRTLAAAIRSNLRSFDPIVRYGGDEFVCGLSGVDPESVERRFGAIDQELQDAVGVGITVGLASLLPNDTLDKLISRADAALLDGKRRRDE